MDINPVTEGHTLVVPRAHSTDLFDISAEDLAACGELAQEVALRAKERLGATGVNVLNCSGRDAWQTVFHFHLHVIPRFKDEPGKDAIGLPWATVPGDPTMVASVGAQLV
jgi:histidine triad (HIT) family protein